MGRVPVHKRTRRSTASGLLCNGLLLKVHPGSAVNLSATTAYPVNLGMACPKGWEALAPLSAKDRATTPYLRRNGVLEPVDWPTAMDAFVGRFKDIQSRHGKDSVAFLSTGQIVAEEMAFLGSLAKFGMGVVQRWQYTPVHGDHGGLQAGLLPDAPPYQDFEESMCWFSSAPSPYWCTRSCSGDASAAIPKSVTDPRKTETAMVATRHLPLAPKSTCSCFMAWLPASSSSAWSTTFIEAHTHDFAAFKASGRPAWSGLLLPVALTMPSWTPRRLIASGKGTFCGPWASTRAMRACVWRSR